MNIKRFRPDPEGAFGPPGWGLEQAVWDNIHKKKKGK